MTVQDPNILNTFILLDRSVALLSLMEFVEVLKQNGLTQMEEWTEILRQIEGRTEDCTKQQ
jgi:hypothetical protein